MILKLLISVVFVGAAVQKFTGKVAPNWDRWGYSRQFMYATGIAELSRWPSSGGRDSNSLVPPVLVWCCSAHWER